MADQHPSVLPAGDHTRQPEQQHPTPWYARAATTVGRPLVLAATLVMSMPGEYHVARYAGWSDPWAYGMPFSLSAYAGIAAVVAATRPKGGRGRASATLGAALAIILALAAQVVAHLSATSHMDPDQAWLIAVTSTVPPAVLAHLLHLAATPTAAAETPAVAVVTTPVAQRAEAPPAPAGPPPAPAPAPPAMPAYDDERCAAVRPLYNSGYRPGTAAMRTAIVEAGYDRPADSVIRGTIRPEVERREPELAALPQGPTPIRRTS